MAEVSLNKTRHSRKNQTWTLIVFLLSRDVECSGGKAQVAPVEDPGQGQDTESSGVSVK